ncbi:MAG: hypothetical protein K2X66_15165 [Cyanobacteria bacterium]|nr:hypothetical protein [Cyanobacteriota bacterium]
MHLSGSLSMVGHSTARGISPKALTRLRFGETPPSTENATANTTNQASPKPSIVIAKGVTAPGVVSSTEPKIEASTGVNSALPPAAPPPLKSKSWSTLKWIASFAAVFTSISVDVGYRVLHKDPIQMVQMVHRNTKPMPKEMVDTLKPFFDHAPYPIDFEQLQVVPEFIPGFHHKNHVLPGFHGTVVLHEREYQEYLNFDTLPQPRKKALTILFAHELAHLVQMQMLGRNEFLTRISQQSLEHDNVYETQSEVFQKIFSEKEQNNLMRDPTMFVHPQLTLEQNAVLVETFIGNRLKP